MSKSTEPEAKTLYTDDFYFKQRGISYESANRVLPLVLSVVPAKSAIDVGCGAGTWTSKLMDCGVSDVLGIDGDYVNLDLLRIPRAAFQAWDLRKPIAIDRRFDLAVCLEVAEHLPPKRAGGLVEDLVKLAPVVLFSAAIPGQGGVNHINERYLSYWANLFAARDYVLVDIIRPAIWNDEKCDGCYRQNAVLFVHKENPLSRLQVASGVDYVHPYLLNAKNEGLDRPLLGYLIRSLPSSIGRSLRARALR